MSKFSDKYNAQERDKISDIMTQIGWAYWADQEVECWESLVLGLYHIIMTAGERQLNQVRKAIDADYDDHPSTFAE